MPVYWTIKPKAPGNIAGAFALADAEGAEYWLDLKPHLSMGPRGFVRMITISAAFLALPLLAVLGSPVLWGLLPFAGLALWGLWYALSRNATERQRLHEGLHLTRDAITITRSNPRAPDQHWTANPYWVRLRLTDKGAKVDNYLTLEGGGRTVELGAFLSAAERARLHDDLSLALRHLR